MKLKVTSEGQRKLKPRREAFHRFSSSFKTLKIFTDWGKWSYLKISSHQREPSLKSTSTSFVSSLNSHHAAFSTLHEFFAKRLLKISLFHPKIFPFFILMTMPSVRGNESHCNDGNYLELETRVSFVVAISKRKIKIIIKNLPMLLN